MLAVFKHKNLSDPAAVLKQIYMPNSLVMSLKNTWDHLFQLVYSPSLQTQLLDSINILHIDPEPPGSTWSSLTRSQQDLLQLCMPSRNEDTQTGERAHALSLSLMLPISSSYSPTHPITSLFIIHYVSLWIQREQKHGWIHGQTQQFAQGNLSNVKVCACEEEKEEWREIEGEWMSDRLTNWLTETKKGRGREFKTVYNNWALIQALMENFNVTRIYRN